MSTSTQVLSLDIVGYSDNRERATVRVVTLSAAARVRRASVGLIVCWIGAAVAVFIPVAHFMLVPGFFLLGVYLFLVRAKEGQYADQARGTCPDCRTEQDLDLIGRWTLPTRVTCRGCQRFLELRAPAE